MLSSEILYKNDAGKEYSMTNMKGDESLLLEISFNRNCSSV